LTDSLIEIPVNKVLIENRVRKSFANIVELAESIKKTKGLIHPIVVTPVPDQPDKYKLVAGERRYRAYLLAMPGKPIKANVRLKLSDLDLREMELEENLQREAMSFEEEIDGLRLLDELKRQIHGDQSPHNPEGWSLDKAEKLLGQDKSTISVKINLSKKLQERPDLREQIVRLPIQQAMKAIKQIETRERAQRLVDSGLIKVTVKYQHGDCLELIKTLPDQSVDLFLSDPPFGMEAIEEQRGHTPTESNAYIAQLSDHDNSSAEHMTMVLRSLAPELKRVLKPTAHFYIFFQFGIYRPLVDCLTEVGFDVFSTPLIWDKGRSTSPFKGYTYQPRYEPILYGQVSANQRRLTKASTNILEYTQTSHAEKVHPFQKPQELLTFLIQQSTNHGETVLDCFAGSGSTLKAATTIGRQAIGFELSKDRWTDGMAYLNSVEMAASPEA
jgi:site-specific DNA-methyltransferase (adenine-specific)